MQGWFWSLGNTLPGHGSISFLTAHGETSLFMNVKLLNLPLVQALLSQHDIIATITILYACF